MDTQSKSGLPHGSAITSEPGHPPPPPPYASPPQAAQPVVVGVSVMPTMGGTMIVTNQMGPNPTRTVCRSCHQEVVSVTKSKPSMRTHLIAAILCVTFLWPCVCIPYCVDSCMNTEHYCPNCNSYMGAHVN